jgi:hypothetical protein
VTPIQMRFFLLIVLVLQAVPSLAVAQPVSILDVDQIPSEGVTQVWSPLFQATWDELSKMQSGDLKEVIYLLLCGFC